MPLCRPSGEMELRWLLREVVSPGWGFADTPKSLHLMRLFNYVDRGRLLKVYGRSVLKYGTPRKIWNALRTEWAYRTRRIDVRTPPYILFIEPIYYCNLKCPLCPR